MSLRRDDYLRGRWDEQVYQFADHEIDSHTKDKATRDEQDQTTS